MQSPSASLERLDLWARVDRDGLPAPLRLAVERKDWLQAKTELSRVMDGQTTDGVYGRALIQLALELPAGVDPLFDRYRAAAAVDHGGWDRLLASIAPDAIAPAELLGINDLPPGRLALPAIPAGLYRWPLALYVAP